jgi:hypothetical protein
MKKISFIILTSLFSFTLTAQKYQGESRTQSPEERLNEMYCSGFFKHTDGTILDVASVPGISGWFNILDWMQGRVAGLQVFTNRSGLRVPVIRGNVPGIYLDEIPVSLSVLNSLNINDIAMVKVIRTPFLGGFNGAGGAIAIYTLGGEEEEEDESK